MASVRRVRRPARVLRRYAAPVPASDPTTAFSASRSRAPKLRRWRRIGLWTVFLWFALGGLAHFVATEAEMRVVPPWVPWPRAAVQVSGVFEWLGAAGLLWPATRRVAGWGLVALTLAVTPVHVYMLQQPELFRVPWVLLVLRLPLQLLLLMLIVWSTRPEPALPAAASAPAR